MFTININIFNANYLQNLKSTKEIDCDMNYNENTTKTLQKIAITSILTPKPVFTCGTPSSVHKYPLQYQHTSFSFLSCLKDTLDISLFYFFSQEVLVMFYLPIIKNCSTILLRSSLGR